MADINQETQQLAMDMENLRNSVQNGTATVDQWDETLKANSENVVKEFGNFTKSVGKGETAFSSLNPVIDSLAKALGGMVSSIPFAQGAVEATAEASKFVIDQLDKTAGAFKQLSEVGALTERGMSGVQQQFLSSGLTLDTFKKIVTENATTLARFGGIVGTGADKFAASVGTLLDQNSEAGMALRNLGFDAEAIGTTAAAFLRQQTLLGKQQKLTIDQLTQGTVAYARELDELAKLTGMSRAEAAKAQERALADTSFLATTMLMERENRGAAAKSLLTFTNMFDKESPTIAKGLRDLASGVVGTDEAAKVLRDTNGEAAVIVNQLKNGMIDQHQAAAALSDVYKRTNPQVLNLMSVAGDTTNTYTKLSERVAAANIAFDDQGNVIDRLKSGTQSQAQAQDQLTKDTVNAGVQMEKLNRDISTLGMGLTKNAVPAIEGFAGALKEVTGWVKETLDIQTGSTPAPAPGSMPSGGGASAPAAGSKSGGKGAATKAKAPVDISKIDAEISRFTARNDMNIQANKDYVAGLQAKKAEAVATQQVGQVIDFGGDSGSRSNFEALNPAFRDKVLQAAMDYNSATGNKLKINSAYRDPEKQRQLYQEWIASGRQGKPVAPPGTSRHEQGLAIDIQNYSDNKAVAALNRQGLYQTVANDLPHFSAKFGKVLRGPKSGYKATLHGPEAVVPLKGGRSIPVEMPVFVNALESQNQMMAVQTNKLDELIDVMRSNKQVSTQILQAARA